MNGSASRFPVFGRLLGSGRRALVLGALPLIVAGALLTVPAASAGASNVPASAHPAPVHAAKAPAANVITSGSPSQCPSTYLCFWVNAGWGGAMGKLAGSNTSWTVFPQSQCQTGNWNDCASALFNNGTQDQALVYQNVSFGGGLACIARGTQIYSNLTQWTYGTNTVTMNDTISSNNWTSSPCG